MWLDASKDQTNSNSHVLNISDTNLNKIEGGWFSTIVVIPIHMQDLYNQDEALVSKSPSNHEEVTGDIRIERQEKSLIHKIPLH